MDPGNETEAAIKTGARSYALKREQRFWLNTVLDIRFTNLSPQTMYIVTCRGELDTPLEKWTENGWVRYWSPILPDCLSPPIVIEPGASLERSVTIFGALPGNNAGPAWEYPDVPGTYRMVLESVVWNYTYDAPPLGNPVPLELRTSNSFVLRR